MRSLKGWLSAAEAAERIGCHRNSVLRAVKEGRLHGEMLGHQVAVHETALRRYQPQPRRRRGERGETRVLP